MRKDSQRQKRSGRRTRIGKALSLDESESVAVYCEMRKDSQRQKRSGRRTRIGKALSLDESESVAVYCEMRKDSQRQKRSGRRARIGKASRNLITNLTCSFHFSFLIFFSYIITFVMKLFTFSQTYFYFCKAFCNKHL